MCFRKSVSNSRILTAVGVLALLVLRAEGSSKEFEVPWHEKIIASLRSNTNVIPDKPDVFRVRAMYNREGVVPPQCYTKTVETYNPCYVCHQDAVAGRENVMNDGPLQAEYSFSDLGQTNHWKNLFEDRTERVANISDESILEYISIENYSDLAERLRAVDFEGWIPDLGNLHLGAEAFDEFGFALDGSHWVAFNYKPLPSTFWPTNGSTDDVMIRLAEPFRTTMEGTYSLDVYRANLAILEANIKGFKEIGCLPVDETSIGVDLNGDGKLSVVTSINQLDRYVGAAADRYLDTHLYPQETEFLHSVRYVGVTGDGEIHVPQRMKELRYMKKWKEYGKPFYGRRYEEEAFDKDAGNLPGYRPVGDHGIDNGTGWAVQGFIEGVDGRLRVSTFEENFFCMGCHNSIGSTIDKTFSFPRKVDGAEGWSYINLKGMPDAPSKGETLGEIVTYLGRVGGGSEFRNNDEMASKWFHKDGTINVDALAKAADVYDLITPSPERALLLNKAYKTIVEDQDYIYGRDAMVTPPENVYDRVDNQTSLPLPDDKVFKYNIILDWERDS